MKNKKDDMRAAPFKNLGDDMLDKDGTIVEPDVRKRIKDYFKRMRLREANFPHRATFYANPYEDFQDDAENPDDPVGLQLMARKIKLEKEISGESLVRSTIREMIVMGENEEPPELSIPKENLCIITIPSTAHSMLTVIYSSKQLENLAKYFAGLESGPADDLIISGVEWGKPGGESEGTCNNAYVVRRSVRAFKKWGRAAYIAAVDATGKDGLAPDRGRVEKSAEKVWSDILNNLEAFPFEDLENQTAKDSNATCKFHHGRPVLNASYKIKGSLPSELSAMKRNGEKQFKQISEEYGENVVKRLKTMMRMEFYAVWDKYKPKDL